jgi:hypothetical protein
VTYNIQIGKIKIKLLVQYESVAQKVLLIIELMLQNDKQLQHARLSWHMRYPSFLDSMNIFLQSARSSRSFSTQSLETALTNVG